MLLHEFYTTPTLRLVVSEPAGVDADVLVIPVAAEADTTGPALPDGVAAAVAALRASGELKGEPHEQHWLRGEGTAAGRVLLLGIGAAGAMTTDLGRRLGTAAGLATRSRGFGRVAVVAHGGLSDEAVVRALAEGLTIAAFHVDAYKTKDRKLADLHSAAIVVSEGGASTLADAVALGSVLGEATNVARALAHEPPNVLTPVTLAARAQTLFAGTPVQVDVLDEAQMHERHMGLLLGVAQGSVNTPRMIVLTYDPGVEAGRVLGLIGKAVTFDTGGISIKPAENMDRMKYDMCGGAAVIGAFHAIARTGAPCKVIGVIPSVENMPSASAFRPGDVLTGASGATVEITNTDAEGRLILADALWYARHLGATHLVDIATLTGACAVALGRVASGLFGTPDSWRGAVQDAGVRGGDFLWPLPMTDDYKDLLKSDIADMVNAAGTRYGGAISAALFLKAFAGDTPWAHLDIAGTAWADEPKPWQPKGPTGVAVRTLVELARSSRAWH
ncbi:MAG: leucyl aminopeptidase [Acidobacteria bacterium]|nr:leucyl aminopeptidase [Acidobacteriota bacterium]